MITPTHTPTLPSLHTRIARHLSDQTGVWFGPHDIGTAITLALRSTGQTRLVIRWSERHGLHSEGVELVEFLEQLATALNHVASIKDPDEHVALGDAVTVLCYALRLAFGQRGGVWRMWREGWDIDNALLPMVDDVVTWGNN